MQIIFYVLAGVAGFAAGMFLRSKLMLGLERLIYSVKSLEQTVHERAVAIETAMFSIPVAVARVATEVKAAADAKPAALPAAIKAQG